MLGAISLVPQVWPVTEQWVRPPLVHGDRPDLVAPGHRDQLRALGSFEETGDDGSHVGQQQRPQQHQRDSDGRHAGSDAEGAVAGVAYAAPDVRAVAHGQHAHRAKHEGDPRCLGLCDEQYPETQEPGHPVEPAIGKRLAPQAQKRGDGEHAQGRWMRRQPTVSRQAGNQTLRVRGIHDEPWHQRNEQEAGQHEQEQRVARGRPGSSRDPARKTARLRSQGTSGKDIRARCAGACRGMPMPPRCTTST